MRLSVIFILFFATVSVSAQRTLRLEDCRKLALENNKQLRTVRLGKEIAYNNKKVMATKSLPKVDMAATYQFTSREISILNKEQKSALANLGTNALSSVSALVTGLVQQGLLTPSAAQELGELVQKAGLPLANAANNFGKGINEAFRTDTRNLWSGTIMFRQPVYMGGAISAANKMADIGMDMANDNEDLATQNLLYAVDHVYWTYVSLKQKETLADSYRNLIQKLRKDVYKMIEEGVATRADGLKVDVRLNEADMQRLQVTDGLTLAKMLLCQLCGLPLETELILTDEVQPVQNTDSSLTALDIADTTFSKRPEIRLLGHAVELSTQHTKLVRSEYLPHILLTGGYFISNPNLYNGFERKFAGTWNVGLTVAMPIWTWFESKYKIRSAKSMTTIARLNLANAQEQISLQVSQSKFKMTEAVKRLRMAESNLASAEENLRCATVGFKEGVMGMTEVLAAQTAWQAAQTSKIDAAVEFKLSKVELQKSLGTLK